MAASTRATDPSPPACPRLPLPSTPCLTQASATCHTRPDPKPTASAPTAVDQGPGPGGAEYPECAAAYRLPGGDPAGRRDPRGQARLRAGGRALRMGRGGRRRGGEGRGAEWTGGDGTARGRGRGRRRRERLARPTSPSGCGAGDVRGGRAGRVGGGGGGGAAASRLAELTVGRSRRAPRPLRAHTAASQHQRSRRVPARRAATRPGPPSGWPSGLRRCVQVAVSPGGVGSNPTPDTPTFWRAQRGHGTPAGLDDALSQAPACLTGRSCLAPELKGPSMEPRRLHPPGHTLCAHTPSPTNSRAFPT